MKFYRNAIILVVIVGLLTGAYFLMKNRDIGAEDDTPASETIRIFDLDSAKFTEMTLENKDGTFIFVQELVKLNDTELRKWRIKSPEDLKINDSAVSSIAINFSSLRADKLIEENPADLALYGLDKPVTVTVKLDTGETKALEIGSLTPTKGGYYAREKGGSKVYTIGTYEGEKMLVDKNGLRSKEIFEFAAEDITAFGMDRNGVNIFTSEKSSETEWQMTTPIEASVRSEAIGTMLDAVTQLSVAAFEDENPADLEKYGLAKPAYVLSIGDKTDKTRLMIGLEKEKGSIAYAKLEGSNEVFSLSISALTFLDKPIEEIVDAFVYIVYINDVNKITMKLDGETVVSDIQTDAEDSDKDKFFVNGKDVSELKDDRDSQLFRKYYQAMIGITVDKVLPEAVVSGNAEVTLVYELKKDPGTMKVELIPKDEKYYYVMRNGKYAGVLVEKKKLDEAEGLREAWKTMKEAMNQQ